MSATTAPQTLHIATSGWHYEHWAGAISSWLRAGKEVFCFFDNDQAGYAPQNALRLQEIFDADL